MHQGALTLFSDDPDEAALLVPLEAEARPPPRIEISPVEFDATLEAGATELRSLTIRNLEGSELVFEVAVEPVLEPSAGAAPADARPSVEASPSAPGRLVELEAEGEPGPASPPGPTETLGAPLALSGPVPAVQAGPFPFAEDFEDGNLDGWTLAPGGGIREVTAATAANGTQFSYRELDVNEGHNQGIHRLFPGLEPRYVSFWVRLGAKTADAGYFVLRDTAGLEVIWFFATDTGRFYVNGDVGGDVGVRYEPNRWYFIELKNIDFGAKRFDYFVDRQRIRRNIGFRNRATAGAFGRLDLYNFDPNAEAFWDEIVFAAAAPFTPVTVEPSSGRVSAGGAAEVRVTLDAVGLNAGDYGADLVVRSNDPASPVVVVPVHLRVEGRPIIGVSRSTLDFGRVRFGEQLSLAVTTTNFGTDTLVIAEVRVGDPQFSADTSGFTLRPEQSRAVTVTFTPERAGPVESGLVLVSNDSTRPELAVTLLGEGLVPAAVEIAPEALSEVRYPGEASTRALTVRNTGGEALVYSVELREPGGGEIRAEGTLFADDAEGGPGGWVPEVYARDNLWHLTERQSHSPPTSWWCGQEDRGHYGTPYGISTALISPPLDLRSLPTPLTLTFYENYITEPGFDQCLVDVSVDGGATWVPLRGSYGAAPSGDSRGWVLARLDLSPFAGKIARLRFYFETQDPTNNALPGWFIDDVRVTAGVAPWLAVVPDAGLLPRDESDELQVIFNALQLRPPGPYQGTIEIHSNDPARPRVDVPAAMIVNAPPRLALPGPLVTVESQQNLAGRRTAHALELPQAPAGPGEVQILLEGDYGAAAKTGTASAEGLVLGRVGGDGGGCVVAERVFPVAAGELDGLAADGLIELEVRNAPGVGTSCPANRHGVRLSYPAALERLELGQAVPGLPAQATLTVANAGDGELRVDSIATERADITLAPGSLILAPHSSAAVRVTWTPLGPGVLEGATLRLASNDPARPLAELPLSGEALAPPAELRVEPERLVAALPPRSARTQRRTLRLENRGQGPLVWSAEPVEFAVLEPREGTVPPGGSATLTLVLGSAELDAGDYEAPLVLHSNDPLRARFEVPLVLHVAEVELERFEIDFSPKQADPAQTVEVVLGLPRPYGAEEVELGTVELAGLGPRGEPVRLEDLDGDGVAELVLQFDAARLAAALPPGELVPVRIEGEVRDRAWFAGTTWVKGVAEVQR
jgi:hypothetical protein